MDLGEFHHVALTVTDLERSAAWYADVLGLEESFRESSAQRSAVIFRFTNGSAAIGLVQHVSTAQDFDPAVTGLDHVAFTVSTEAEMFAWADRLTSRGVAHSGPIEVPPGRILNFKDPDGIALSLFWDRPR
jgi:glyoxylase I family protein